jgi:hypothetical protein
MNRTVLTPVLIPLLTALAFAATPERAKGISMHMLPKRVADLGGNKWGLTVTAASYLTPDAASTTLQTGAEFRSFVRKQSSAVKQNGVWIVTTNPEAYSKPENTFLEQVMSICAAEKVPLFVCRASELPDGWKRYDRLD